jgi:asparagine synthase (glutamine-hydrolysing)
MPYLNENLVTFCFNLPYELKIKGSERKYILRKLAKEIGLSDEIAFKKKKSAQYGTGIMKIMKKIAKQNDMTLGEYIMNC